MITEKEKQTKTVHERPEKNNLGNAYSGKK